MSASLAQLADALVAALQACGILADRFRTGTDSEGVNVWAPAEAITDEDPNLNRYPQASVILSDSGNFHEYSWGPHFEHIESIDTPAGVVAQRIINTLPGDVRKAADR